MQSVTVMRASVLRLKLVENATPKPLLTATHVIQLQLVPSTCQLGP